VDWCRIGEIMSTITSKIKIKIMIMTMKMTMTMIMDMIMKREGCETSLLLLRAARGNRDL
jgi:hypothetical protein